MDESLSALTRTINKLGAAFDAFKETNDERIKALEEGDHPKAAELATKLGKIELDLGKLGKLKSDIEVERKALTDRIEELESRKGQPGATVIDKINTDHKSLFNKWVRSQGRDFNAENELKSLEQKMKVEAQANPERKDVTIGSGATGGFAVPEVIARDIEKLERKFSPVRDLVKVVQASTSDYKELIDLKGATSGWVSETSARTATATATLRERVPTHGEQYAYPQVSEWSLNDIFFNVEEWLKDGVAEAFAIDLGEAVIRGNGTTKPTGMLNTAPTDQDDAFPPVRSAEAYEFVLNPNSPESNLDSDTLLALVYTLNARYRPGSSWIMNSNLTGSVRRLKTTDGAYHWQPGLKEGEPDRLLGYPHANWEQMDDATNGKHPIGFGNWRRAYLLVDIVGLRATRDEVTNPGYVRFYIRRRVGGIVLNNDAAKFLKIA